MTTKIIIKLILTVLFLLCLADWEYGYYQFVRFLGMIGFLLLAGYDKENKAMLTLWISSAILINPFFKIALGRTLWNFVDVVWAIILVASMIYEKKK
jgi:hypothetical protein